MAKPLLRYTISNVSDYGFQCLRCSIIYWRKIFKDRFDIAVCHNSLNEKQLEFVKGLDVLLVDQSEHTDSIKFEPQGSAWKLYPPRLRPHSHEVFIDNDVVIYKFLPFIDEFLASKNKVFITEAVKRMFGQFNGIIAPFHKINSGFFGLYPEFDFGLKIDEVISQGLTGWKSHFDDQGLVASILLKEKNFRLVTRKEIAVSHTDFGCEYGAFGTHFIGLNAGSFVSWCRFLTRSLC